MESRVLMPPNLVLGALVDTKGSQISRFLEQEVTVRARQDVPKGFKFHPVLGCSLKAGDIDVFSIIGKDDVSLIHNLFYTVSSNRPAIIKLPKTGNRKK